MAPQPPPGRSMVATLVLLAGVAIVMAVVGYMLAGGRLISRGTSVAEAPATAVPTAPPQPTTVPTAPPQPTTVAVAPTSIPAPTLAPTAAPTLAPTAPPKPTVPPPTAVPPTAVPPTAIPTPVPQPAAPAVAAAPPVPAAPGGAMVPVRPGMDTRQAQIEGKIRGYFEALNAGDFARAQQVCCTAEWRARYPVERWQHNFDGVTDLRMVGTPRYLDVRDDRVVVENDYTFVSGGVRRNLTLRWTFRLVNGEWQGDMAEAYATP